MELSVCATGDLMLLEKFPGDYDVDVISNMISKCDVRITNIESVVSDWNCFASTFCGGQWINTEPDLLEEIKRYGFNIYGCANNHSMDFSFDGVLSTCKELEDRGMKYAGIGSSLKNASAPVHLETECGGIKTAFISVTSTFIDAARAGESRDGIPARPGVNPLRVNTRYYVTKEHFEQLKEIAEATYINGERDNARKIGSLPPEEEGSINFGGHFFIISEHRREGKYTYCNESDLNRILDEISNAKKTVDYVFVSIHSHQIRRTEYTEPDFFLEEFAHRCVEAGACAVFGGGTHQLKPIEIYKGRPIFYSLGNFVFQTDRVRKLPADFWDKYHYPKELSVEEGMARKTHNGTVGLEQDENNYLSVIPVVKYKEESLWSIELIPIELGFDKGKGQKGLPVAASEQSRRRIFCRLCDISKEFGTEFSLEGKKIIIKWKE